MIGENDYDHLGSSVSLSADGNLLAVSMPMHDAASIDAGQVRIYFWNGTNWMKRGQDINGSVAGEEFGTQVHLNGDGTILAVGAPKNSSNGTNSGQVLLLEWW